MASVYEVRKEKWGSKALDDALAEGWEPFAVMNTNDGTSPKGAIYIVHLRRSSDLDRRTEQIRQGRVVAK